MTNPYRPGSTRTNPLAIVSLISAFVLSLVAVITGHLALRQIKRTGEGGRGLAIAGVTIGYAGLVAGIVVIAVLITGGIAAVNDQLAEPEPSGASTSEVYELPSPSLAEGRDWTGTITINGQDVDVTLDGAAAPQAVSSFLALGDDGFFDGTSCHRLVTQGIYVLQCGDPTGTGTGGPGYSYGPIENAPKDDVYPAGTLAMARIGGDGESMGSQFFIVYDDSTIPSDAAGGYTVLGTITGGLDVVTGIADKGTKSGASDGAPADPAVIDGVSFE
ncbi:peptidylprolyl isomerase [Agreia sp. Leaf335]|uniref:peptidylprolyl isomerase n=1 Tax=Agreia sp. Leaf335 TaxID=1736340 RepID=UPI000AFFB688|nr:peptidylprolyl isomerase [Agreia sp. Leaf335]